MKNIFSKPWTRYLLTVLIGLFLGWIFFKDSEIAHEMHEHSAEADASIWTCSMHPQIRHPEPGKCPICGMDLTPLASMNNETSGGDPAVLEMTAEAAALANITVSTVRKAKAENQISLTGKIKADEQRVATIASSVPGRVERLYVSFTGQEVKRGQRLAAIYSPELMTAQRELIEAAAFRSVNPELYEAAREKLRLWKINEKQIDAIEQTGKVQAQFDVYADRSGYVANRLVSVGDYVSRGTPLLDIVDLNRLWVMLDAYESDLAWINIGDKATFTVAALPGEEFQAEVAYIDPAIDPQTRTASARAEVVNRDGKLKPEMFVSAAISASLELEEESLAVPRTAVLWTGKRSIVYVKVPGDKPAFKMREVTLGPRMGEAYVVRSGLQAGEQVATNGVFSIDAAAQLQGKASMMNPEGIRNDAEHGHDHSQSGEPVPSNDEFKNQFNDLFALYIRIKDALVNEEPAQAGQDAKRFKDALSKMDKDLLQDQARQVWMEKSERIQSAAGRIAGTQSIEDQRQAFSNLTAAFYATIRQFQVENLDGYYQYCPMAFNNKGGYWLSQTEEIRNPYFGESMMTCGSTEETI